MIVGMVVGHFFLFCNVFRISRMPELVWAAVFTVLTMGTLAVNFPGWTGTVSLSVLLAVLLIFQEMKRSSYHGVAWRRINPGLPAWWRSRVDGAGKM
jgi:hypothetical protein